MTTGGAHLRVELWDSDGVYGQANYEYFEQRPSAFDFRRIARDFVSTSGDVADALDSFFSKNPAGVPLRTHSGADEPENCNYQNSPGWWVYSTGLLNLQG